MTTAETGVHVLLAGGELLMQLARPVPVEVRAVPDRARMRMRCPACDSPGEAAGAVTFMFIDDDHYGRFELAYKADLNGVCPRCSHALEARLHLTLTRYGDSSAELLCERAIQW